MEMLRWKDEIEVSFHSLNRTELYARRHRTYRLEHSCQRVYLRGAAMYHSLRSLVRSNQQMSLTCICQPPSIHGCSEIALRHCTLHFHMVGRSVTQHVIVTQDYLAEQDRSQIAHFSVGKLCHPQPSPSQQHTKITFHRRGLYNGHSSEEAPSVRRQL
jgi:hypothetical protein